MGSNLENTQAQMRKGVLEFCILSILSQEEVYPSDIIARMKDSKMIVVEGTLYPLLTRLKNAGLLTYRWEESKSGPPRKYYSLTPLGEKFLEELRITWNELVEAVRLTTQKPDYHE
ncbi:MAG: PadR family transcriptional regulator [Bacteroidia bacterium]|nr:PadR family transcriptional regulator [Bacteroidia bacterium]